MGVLSMALADSAGASARENLGTCFILATL
jgi:hypothetical protein